MGLIDAVGELHGTLEERTKKVDEAIEEGATHVRVGTSIFGKRAYRVDGELG